MFKTRLDCFEMATLGSFQEHCHHSSSNISARIADCFVICCHNDWHLLALLATPSYEIALWIIDLRLDHHGHYFLSMADQDSLAHYWRTYATIPATLSHRALHHLRSGFYSIDRSALTLSSISFFILWLWISRVSDRHSFSGTPLSFASVAKSDQLFFCDSQGPLIVDHFIPRAWAYFAGGHLSPRTVARNNHATHCSSFPTSRYLCVSCRLGGLRAVFCFRCRWFSVDWRFAHPVLYWFSFAVRSTHSAPSSTHFQSITFLYWSTWFAVVHTQCFPLFILSVQYSDQCPRALFYQLSSPGSPVYSSYPSVFLLNPTRNSSNFPTHQSNFSLFVGVFLFLRSSFASLSAQPISYCSNSRYCIGYYWLLFGLLAAGFLLGNSPY